MVYQFRTEADDELYVIDTNPENLTWARCSSIVSAPSVTAVENQFARYVPIEQGKLIPHGAGSYTFDGRNPNAPENKGKKILSEIGLLSIPVVDTLYIYLSTLSVRFKENSFQVNGVESFTYNEKGAPIKKIECRILQAPKKEPPIQQDSGSSMAEQSDDNRQVEGSSPSPNTKLKAKKRASKSLGRGYRASKPDHCNVCDAPQMVTPDGEHHCGEPSEEK